MIIKIRNIYQEDKKNEEKLVTPDKFGQVLDVPYISKNDIFEDCNVIQHNFDNKNAFQKYWAKNISLI